MENQTWTIVQYNADDGTLPWVGLYGTMDEAKAAILDEMAYVWDDATFELEQIDDYWLAGRKGRVFVFEGNCCDDRWFLTQHQA